MKTLRRSTLPRVAVSRTLLVCLTAFATVFSLPLAAEDTPGAAGQPYPNMPAIAPLGVRIGRHLKIPEASKGPAIDPKVGYRRQDLGKGLHVVTDNLYQCMFLVCSTGVVLVDAPPSLAKSIPKAIAEVTDKSITHVVYSHAHIDHISGTKALGGNPIIVAHDETKRLLTRANDPDRPIPTLTFAEKHTLEVGGQTLELSYHGNGHQPGNIFIYVPSTRTLMAVDIVFPGWMPWRRFALAQDIPAFFAQVQKIHDMDWDTLVSGHVARTGTHADVAMQLEFMTDLKKAARRALKETKAGETVDPADAANPFAVYGNYIDRVVIRCVNELTPKWSSKLAGFDVYIWDQCYAMEQSLRIDEP
jgi:glyoxylase-like metal-dependent hydrolase (beta-lactamase superfamily II)